MMLINESLCHEHNRLTMRKAFWNKRKNISPQLFLLSDSVTQCFWRISLVLELLRSMVLKTRTTFSADQIPYLNLSRLALPHFPALWTFCLILLWVLIGFSMYFPFFWLAVVITLVLIYDTQSKSNLFTNRFTRMSKEYQNRIYI